MTDAAVADRESAEREALGRAMRRRFGANVRVENLDVPTLGGVNRTLIFDLVEGGARRRLVSRQVTLVEGHSPFIAATDQFKTMQVAFRHGLPVPEPLLEYESEDGLGIGYLNAFVAGETMPNRILKGKEHADIRPRLSAQLGTIFAQLHAIDPAEAPFLEKYPESKDVIQAWTDTFDAYREAHPVIEVGLRWLERNRPDPRPRRILHSDLRTGNFMVGPDGINAVLDWECAHIGNALEDIAYPCVRSWRFNQYHLPVGGFGERAPLYEAYEAAGGEKIDPDEVRYWEILGLVRWAIYNVMQGYSQTFTARRGLIYAAMGRNTSLVEYELLMFLLGRYS
jgi:aminoglycoside phosphotransferase (APT) family kinase protein